MSIRMPAALPASWNATAAPSPTGASEAAGLYAVGSPAVSGLGVAGLPQSQIAGGLNPAAAATGLVLGAAPEVFCSGGLSMGTGAAALLEARATATLGHAALSGVLLPGRISAGAEARASLPAALFAAGLPVHPAAGFGNLGALHDPARLLHRMEPVSAHPVGAAPDARHASAMTLRGELITEGQAAAEAAVS